MKRRDFQKSCGLLVAANSGHGGGDHRLVRDFVEAVAHHDPNRLSSDIDVSMESHMMGFAAERSRRTGKKEKI